MSKNRTHPASVATACGLLLALVLVAAGFAVGELRDAYEVVWTEDGPAVAPEARP